MNTFTAGLRGSQQKKNSELDTDERNLKRVYQVNVDEGLAFGEKLIALGDNLEELNSSIDDVLIKDDSSTPNSSTPSTNTERKHRRKRVSYKEQGNKEYYTEKSLSLRRELYRSKLIEGQIFRFWKTYRKTKEGVVDKKSYMHAHKLISKALDPSWVCHQAIVTAIKDWQHDLTREFDEIVCVPLYLLEREGGEAGSKVKSPRRGRPLDSRDGQKSGRRGRSKSQNRDERSFERSRSPGATAKSPRSRSPAARKQAGRISRTRTTFATRKEQYDVLDYRKLKMSIFEIADTWTDDIDELTYAAFLARLLTAISEPKSHCWKPLDSVKAVHTKEFLRRTSPEELSNLHLQALSYKEALALSKSSKQQYLEVTRETWEGKSGYIATHVIPIFKRLYHTFEKGTTATSPGSINGNKLKLIHGITKGDRKHLNDVILPESGATMLHLACQMGYLDVINALCFRGANIDARNSEGETPLFVSVQALCQDYMQNDGSISAKFPRHAPGEEPLVEIIATLVDFGAKSSIPDIHWVSPINLVRNLKQRMQQSESTASPLNLQVLESLELLLENADDDNVPHGDGETHQTISRGKSNDVELGEQRNPRHHRHARIINEIKSGGENIRGKLRRAYVINSLGHAAPENDGEQQVLQRAKMLFTIQKGHKEHRKSLRRASLVGGIDLKKEHIHPSLQRSRVLYQLKKGEPIKKLRRTSRVLQGVEDMKSATAVGKRGKGEGVGGGEGRGSETLQRAKLLYAIKHSTNERSRSPLITRAASSFDSDRERVNDSLERAKMLYEIQSRKDMTHALRRVPTAEHGASNIDAKTRLLQAIRARKRIQQQQEEEEESKGLVPYDEEPVRAHTPVDKNARNSHGRSTVPSLPTLPALPISSASLSVRSGRKLPLVSRLSTSDGPRTPREGGGRSHRSPRSERVLAPGNRTTSSPVSSPLQHGQREETKGSGVIKSTITRNAKTARVISISTHQDEETLHVRPRTAQSSLHISSKQYVKSNKRDHGSSVRRYVDPPGRKQLQMSKQALSGVMVPPKEVRRMVSYNHHTDRHRGKRRFMDHLSVGIPKAATSLRRACSASPGTSVRRLRSASATNHPLRRSGSPNPHHQHQSPHHMAMKKGRESIPASLNLFKSTGRTLPHRSSAGQHSPGHPGQK